MLKSGVVETFGADEITSGRSTLWRVHDVQGHLLDGAASPPGEIARNIVGRSDCRGAAPVAEHYT